jgi:DHA2 family multidrug resistance protein
MSKSHWDGELPAGCRMCAGALDISGMKFLRTRSVIELRERHGSRLKWAVLGTAMVGMMPAILSSTVVFVAVPELSHFFQVGQQRVQWVSSAFMIALTLAMLLTPWLLIRYGLRITFLAAIIGLLAGGIGCAFAPSFAALIAMRVLEGAASGVLQPIPGIVIMRAVPPEKQGRAMGIFGLGVVLAPALGPVAGGFLIEHIGWRAIFLVVVPFCLLAIALVQRYVGDDPTVRRHDKPLDWMGLIWIGASTIAILNGLSGLDHAPVATLWQIGLGIAGLVSFVPYQLRKSEPLMRLRVFLHRQVAIGSLVAFMYGFSIFGVGYLTPVFLQMALGYSPSQSGMMQVPGFIAIGLAMPVAGRVADHMPPHFVITFGSALLVVSIAALAIVGPETSYLVALAWITIGRLALGIMSPALSIGSARGLARAEIPDAISVNGFARQLGGAVGVSIVGVVLEWRLSANGAGLIDLGADLAQRVRAFDQTFLIVAAISAPLVLAGWFMRARIPPREQDGQAATKSLHS